MSPLFEQMIQQIDQLSLVEQVQILKHIAGQIGDCWRRRQAVRVHEIEPTYTPSFVSMSTEQITAMAQSATLNAVKELHSKGISTYGMQDGTIYETKPNGDRSPLAENLG